MYTSRLNERSKQKIYPQRIRQGSDIWNERQGRLNEQALNNIFLVNQASSNIAGPMCSSLYIIIFKGWYLLLANKFTPLQEEVDRQSGSQIMKIMKVTTQDIWAQKISSHSRTNRHQHVLKNKKEQNNINAIEQHLS
ncbi:hypothetical protein BC941DRAFT_447763 [Chlamydoabsidia padenii]|nr:hypothetical protein BC941DRAFT_447763 [Chlamydoabsidia padenii]